MIYWLTGQPGHGKTVLGDRLASYIEDTISWHKKVFRVDGDDLRDITINKDYSKEGRLKNIKSAQDISLYLHNQGFHVVVSLVSPYEDQRQEFKDFVGEGIKEIYVYTTEIRGREHFHIPDYTPPKTDFISIDTTYTTEDESVTEIINKLNLK
jgi:adenylylsulfate kinase